VFTQTTDELLIECRRNQAVLHMRELAAFHSKNAMISCAEFIPAYSEFFRYLHPWGGPMLDASRFTPYSEYGRHGNVLYRRVLEPLSDTYEFDEAKTDHGACVITVRR